MGRFLCDTSCLVAAACGWHEFHGRTIGELDRRVRDGDDLLTASHSLVESYAVLTRLPSPNRMSAETAMALIEANWSAMEVVHLTAAETWRALRRARTLGVYGGQVYDAVIAACAEKARASTILTWNIRHFARLSGGIRGTGPQ